MMNTIKKIKELENELKKKEIFFKHFTESDLPYKEVVISGGINLTKTIYDKYQALQTIKNEIKILKKEIALLNLELDTSDNILNEKKNSSNQDYETITRDIAHKVEPDHHEKSQDDLDEKEYLKTKVFKVLEQSSNKANVLEKLPKKEFKQNRKWKLSGAQVYTKYFSNEYINQKATIIRYIKEFRSNKTK